MLSRKTVGGGGGGGGAATARAFIKRGEEGYPEKPPLLDQKQRGGISTEK